MRCETMTTKAIGALFAIAAVGVHAETAGPAFPGNEAVRIVNGKRVVEVPPLHPMEAARSAVWCAAASCSRRAPDR